MDHQPERGGVTLSSGGDISSGEPVTLSARAARGGAGREAPRTPTSQARNEEGGDSCEPPPLGPSDREVRRA